MVPEKVTVVKIMKAAVKAQESLMALDWEAWKVDRKESHYKWLGVSLETLTELQWG